MGKGNGNQGKNFILGIGSITNLKEMGISSQHCHSIKDKFETDISMEKEASFSITVIGMKVNILMVSHREMELIIGAMDPFIKDNLKMG